MTRAAALLLVCAAAACGPAEEQVVGTFTSNVVQRNTCRISNGEAPESCVRDEAIIHLRVDLIEDDQDRAWIIGVPRNGESDRRLLGSRDKDGNFLFVEEILQTNADTGCRFTSTIQLSLDVEPEADLSMVGQDPCIALVGREVRTNAASAQCDDINDPAEQITRIQRRRWEPDPQCGVED